MRVLPAAASLLLIALALSVAVAGPELDKARRNTAFVRASLDDANRRARDAETDQDRIGRDMDRLRDGQRDLDRKLGVLRDAKRDLPGKIRTEENQIVKMTDEQKRATADLARLLTPLKDASDRLKFVAEVLKQTIARHVQAFQAGDAFVGRKQAAEAAAQNFESAQKAVLDKVRASSTYTAALTKHQDARKRMAAVKFDDSVAAAQRAAAAQAVIDTESAYVRMETDALSADEALTSAKAGQKRADSEFKKLVDEFEKDLPRRPDVAESQQRVDAAKREAELAAGDARRAEAQIAAARKGIDDSSKLIDKMKKDLAQADVDMDKAQKDIAAIARDLDALDRKSRDLDALAARNRRDADIWDRRYREALAAERLAAQRDDDAAKKKAGN